MFCRLKKEKTNAFKARSMGEKGPTKQEKELIRKNI